MGLLPRLAQNGPPAGFQIPSGVTGPPPGFTPPAGMTGPPPDILSSITAAAAATATDSLAATTSPLMTGPPAGITPPPGYIGPPSSAFGGVGGHGPPKLLSISQSHAMVGVNVMFIILCFAAVGGRFLSRRLNKQKFGADDWFAAVGLVLFIGLEVVQIMLAHSSVGTGHYTIVFLKRNGGLRFGSQLSYSLVTTAAKLSILLLYKRIFNLRIRWFRIAWWTCLALSVANGLVLFVMSFTSCVPHPVSYLWNNPTLCRFDLTSPTAMGFINASIDLALLVLPIQMTWTLQMSKKQKTAISSVFALGLLGVAVSLARAVSIASPNLFTMGISSFAIWSAAECAVALICACLPVMRPLFISITKALPSATSWRSWSRSSRARKLDSSSSKTLTNNSSPSYRGLKRSLFSGDSLEKREYSKVETTIEAARVRSPPPLYSANSKQRINNHIGNHSRLARDKNLEKEYEERPKVPEKDKCGQRGSHTLSGTHNICNRCQGEIRGGWE